MNQIVEFVSQNIMLFAALLVVLVMLIKAELDHQMNKASRLSAAQATRLLNNHDDAVVIDIRRPEEFAAGHIRGALNLPLAGFQAAIDGLEADKAAPLVVVCNSGNTSLKAVRMLRRQGYTQVYDLEGGMQAWQEANLPMARGKKASKKKK